MIQAIETEYKGYRFRSRLEARWAVFFDAIGARWEYEPEGFELSDGTKYLPDFLLHGVRGRGASKNGDIYVEIKGVLTVQDLHKIKLFCDPNDEGFPDGSHPIIIFGQIPDAELKEFKYHNGRSHMYLSFDFDKDHDENFYNLVFSEGDYYWTEPKAGKDGGLVLDYPDNPYDYVDDYKTAEAYKAARQARFEHGENGVKRQKVQKPYNPWDQIMDIVYKSNGKAQLELLQSVDRLQRRMKVSRTPKIDAVDWLLDHGYTPNGHIEHEQEMRVYASQTDDYWQSHPGELENRLYEVFGP